MEANQEKFQFDGSLKKLSMMSAVVGIIAIIISFVMNPVVGWVDYLVNTLYLVTISISGIFFLAVTGVLQASWITAWKRIPEALGSLIPVTFVLMLGLYFGLHTLYEWTHTDIVANDPILSEKVAYLNEPFFMIRLVLIFAAWIFISFKFNAFSKQEEAGDSTVASRQVGFSAVSLILFGLAISFAGFDWVMSIEPHWFSTIFGVYIFAGSFVSGIAFITLAVITLNEKGYLTKYINKNHYHDLGKWMFGMSTFWAYIWVSQYLLIWYANIPEETEYYVLRSHHGWNMVFWANLIINWLLPFFILMTREAKRTAKTLKMVALIILFGHFVDLYLMIAPMVFHHNDTHLVGYGVIQLLQLVGTLGILVFFIANKLSKRSLVAVNDPNLAEASHLHQ